ncbi:DUF3231 family protein [Bacillus sp. ISL-35]|uniref:DUF3231 family protein n=1 Tax=Bacillus sp. ISL-35 TaxID=2819122 RepID=UPI001BE55293|nr:DUF3231 family protein [Bacillus sp. ISL-35]MBT2680915.1 DUF3231 family protein [Bacillus sp. ISL-35]MBT2705231.1 DUF3231 family protein [Chryseobacterium sp. ISL-80]
MEDKTRIDLTAAEMSSLWTQYLNDTVSVCVLSYFLNNIEDNRVKEIVDFALNASQKNISLGKEIFDKEGFPYPIGFTGKDVNVHSPRLFSDTFVMMYIRHMSILGMAANAAAIGLGTRPDVIDHHKSVLKSAIQLQDMTRTLMLEQGTYIRPPFISVPDKVDFVEKQKFLSGFKNRRRALTSVEITHLFMNIQTNQIGKALIMGFIQVAQDKEVKGYLQRGKKIAQKHVDLFSEILKNNDIPAPMFWDSAVTDTTTQIFSDKLIMFHVSAMIAAGIGNYGAAMAASPRKDIGLQYANLIPEIALYAEDGANIMIKNSWLEEPPMADDRDVLSGQK